VAVGAGVGVAVVGREVLAGGRVGADVGSTAGVAAGGSVAASAGVGGTLIPAVARAVEVGLGSIEAANAGDEEGPRVLDAADRVSPEVSAHAASAKRATLTIKPTGRAIIRNLARHRSSRADVGRHR